MKVLIVDDCSTENYSDIISTFETVLDIEYIKLSENMGSGYARNYGYSHSSSPYVFFMDADDSFYNEYSLYLLYKKVKENNYDFVTGGFIQEHEKFNILKDAQISRNSANNQTWVWGRLFSRSFLDKHNIIFNTMRFNEDICYMSLCFALSDNNTFIKNTVYVWHFNENSLTRSKESIFQKNANSKISFIDALIYSHKEKRKRLIVNADKVKEQTMDGLVMSYWYLVEALEENTHKDCERIIQSIQSYYNIITEDYPNIVDSDLLKQSYFHSFDTVVGITHSIIPRITLWELLEDLEDNKNTVMDVSQYGYELG